MTYNEIQNLLDIRTKLLGEACTEVAKWKTRAQAAEGELEKLRKFQHEKLMEKVSVRVPVLGVVK